MDFLYKVAVIIPSWNSSAFIGKMLDCLISQTFGNWKAFVVDDQSNDSSVEIVRHYHEVDKRIESKVRDRQPKGAQTCRNMGLELSEGAEYVIWLDADDLIAPYCLEQRVHYMDRHPDLDFGVFPAVTFNDEIWEDSGWCYGFPFYEDTLRAMLSWTLPMVGWTNIYRRQSLMKAGHRWDERVLSMQDSDFNIQGILLGFSFDYAVKEGALTDYFYRKGNCGNSTSSKIWSTEHMRSHLYLIDKVTSKLTGVQKKKYKKDIGVYLLKYANIFKRSDECFSLFLELPYLRENKLLRLRFYLWKIGKFKYGYSYLFHDLACREYKEYLEWDSLVKQQYKSLPKPVMPFSV